MSKVIFADTQTYRGSDYHVTRIDQVQDDSFKLRLRELEGLDGDHTAEIVGWVAFDQDSSLFTTTVVDADHTMTDLDNIEIHNSVLKPVFADMQTQNGNDPAIVSLGYGDSSTSGGVYIDEETTRDNEVSHYNERVAVAQFNVPTTRTGDLSAPAIRNWDNEVIGGALAHWVHNDEIYDGNRFTVSLTDYFGDDFDMQDMVVIIGPTLRDDLNFRVVSIDNDAETIVIEAQNFGDYVQPPEGVHGVNLGLLVVESGVHRLSDGTAMTAGQVSIDSSTTVTVPIVEADPVDNDDVDDDNTDIVFEDIMVFADTQSYNGNDYNVIRIKGVYDQGFQVKVQELESYDGVHYVEEIGYIALEKSTELFTTDTVEATHVATTAEDIEITHANRNPVFADMQTYNGGDTAMVSLGGELTSSTDGKVYIDEETTRDSETSHVSETVAVAQFNGETIRSYPDVSAPTIDNADGEVIGGALSHWVSNDEIFDGNRITLSLDDYFGDDFDMENMVAIIGPTLRDDLYFRISDIDNDADSIIIEVQDFGDLEAAPDNVHGINLGIIVAEQGVHVLSDGSAMAAGTIYTNHNWAHVELIV